MSEKSVEKLFDSIYDLIDLRVIFRKTSPEHNLNDAQKEEVQKIVERVKQKLDHIQEEMVE